MNIKRTDRKIHWIERKQIFNKLKLENQKIKIMQQIKKKKIQKNN